MGAVTTVLAGSATFGAIATGLVMLVVSVAAKTYANRGNAAYGNRLRRSGGPADGVPYAGAADLGPGAGEGCGGGFDDGGGFGGGSGGRLLGAMPHRAFRAS